MTDEKPKPLMDVRTYGIVSSAGESVWLEVGEHALDVGNDVDNPRAFADAVNAAVEQREARLRGALLATRAREVDGDPCWCHVPPNVSSTGKHATHCDDKRAALDGTGPEYVLKSVADELRAEMRKWQAAFDALDTVERDPFESEAVKSAAVRVVREYLEANGMVKPPEREELIVLHAERLRHISFAEKERDGNWREFRHAVPPIVGPVEIIVRKARYATLPGKPIRGPHATSVVVDEAADDAFGDYPPNDGPSRD